MDPPDEAVNAEPDDEADMSGLEGPDLDPGQEDETDVPEFELQEVMKLLDIDDIIKNLL